MATCVFIENQLEIPGEISSLEEFRRWVLADDYPDEVRIDYINGRIEVDMAADNSTT